MKTNFQYFISALVILTVFCLSSCEKDNLIISEEPKRYNYYLIVKFEKQEYAKYVTATKEKKAKSYSVYGYPMIESEKGKEPYVYLGDGYFLKKWSWWAETLPIYYDHPYPHYLLDTLWTDFSSGLAIPVTTWEVDINMNTPVITMNPATEMYIYQYDQLDKFLGLNYKEMMPEKFHRKVNTYYDLTTFMNPVVFRETFEDKEEYIAVCDSINQIYMNKIQEAFDTNREEFFRNARDVSRYYLSY